MQLTFPSRSPLTLDRAVLVGILNVTPDSFSDGGAHAGVEAAVAHGVRMAGEGAGVIDVGGESTRPGSRRVDEAEQLRRVLPVIERLRAAVDVPISVDTTLAGVARAALGAGADLLNDISAGREDERMFALAAERGVPIVLMHMRGEPATMQRAPHYEGVVEEVARFLQDRAELAESCGVLRSQIVLDPGIGFGKTTAHNLQLIAHLRRVVEMGYPVLLGASRKRFLGEVAGALSLAERDAATSLTTAMAAAMGVKLVRVHNVAVNRRALHPSRT